jgi:hemolysin III
MVLRMREPVNTLTHGFGVILSLVGMVFLLLKVSDPVRSLHFGVFLLFGLSLVGLYLSSTLYHWLKVGPKGIAFLKRLDHSMIFCLIAATYTPICLIALKGGWGWSLFGIVWSIAVLGVVFKFLWLTAPRWLSTGLYIAMGWVVIVAIWPLSKALPHGGLFWLALGGLFYTVGAVIYGLKRPNFTTLRFGFHEIFHIFCILGSVSHFWVMYNYVSILN